MYLIDRRMGRIRAGANKDDEITQARTPDIRRAIPLFQHISPF